MWAKDSTEYYEYYFSKHYTKYAEESYKNTNADFEKNISVSKNEKL